MILVYSPTMDITTLLKEIYHPEWYDPDGSIDGYIFQENDEWGIDDI